MNILKELQEKLPADAQISEVKFEASEVVLYTKSREFFRDGEETIRGLVKDIKKRVELRPDLSIAMDPEKAKAAIEQMVPEEAGVKAIYFEPDLGKVIIEAQKPGLIIGKGGETFKKIKNETLWLPKIERAPAIVSDVVRAVRNLLHSEIPYRKKFLNKIGQEISAEMPKGEEWVRLSSLGGFRQVGRSCLLVHTPHSRIMLDCGIDVSQDGFPYLNAAEFGMDRLDAVVLSHAHLDHSGYIPYLYEKGYKGPLYCTPPTRDLMVLLCMDYIDLAHGNGKEVPYTKKALEKVIKHSVAVGYDEVSDIAPSIRLTFQPAGHILGSALTHLHIGEGFHNILYTGDYKYAPTKLFDPAYTQFQRVETVITESTYGGRGKIMPHRQEVDAKMFSSIEKVIKRGGKVLIPSFAVGRAQELIATLGMNEQFAYPVYIEGMVWDATAIHTAYPEYLSQRLQRAIFHYGKNPFIRDIFKRVVPKTRSGVIDSAEPCVVIATSGMLIGGPSVEYLKALASDPRNMILFVGYQAPGTLGNKIQRGWKEVPLYAEEGRTKTVNLQMEVDTISGLSGHSDRNQLMNFLRRLSARPERVITNHGDQRIIAEFSRDIRETFRVETLTPKNLETVRLK